MTLFPVRNYMELVCFFVPLNVSGDTLKESREHSRNGCWPSLGNNDSSCANEPFGDVLVVINEQLS